MLLFWGTILQYVYPVSIQKALYEVFFYTTSNHFIVKFKCIFLFSMLVRENSIFGIGDSVAVYLMRNRRILFVVLATVQIRNLTFTIF